MSSVGFSNKQTSRITYNLGLTPNEALINIPFDDGKLDYEDSEWFFQERKRRIGDKCTVSSDDNTLFSGKVYEVLYDKNTGMALQCKDARWYASGVRILGGWVYADYLGEYFVETGQALKEGTPAFKLSFTPTFNPGGMPNCIVPKSGIPCFAPHTNFNLQANFDSELDVNLYNTCQYWTLELIIKYIVHYYGSNAASFYDPYPITLKVLPSEIVIPEGFTSSLSSFSSTNFDQGREQGNNNIGVVRKGREVKANGMGVLELIESILNTAGGHTLFLDPTSGESVLKIVPTWYSTQGMSLNVAASGSVQNANVAAPLFQLGTFSENGENVLTECHLTGQSEYIERRISSDDDPANEWALTPAWRPEDEEAFLTKILESPTTVANFSQENWREAVNLYPQVGTTWKIDEDFNYKEGIADITYSLVKAPRHILNNQLSFRAGGELIDYASASYPVYVEVSNFDATAWGTGIELNGFQILDTGSIYIPGLRDIGRIWFWKLKSGGGSYSPQEPNEGSVNTAPAEIGFYKIRMNVALQGDNRLQATVNKLKGLPDGHRIAEGFERSEHIYSNIYRRHVISSNSYPLAKTAIGTAISGLADAGNLFDDTSLAEGHLTRRMYGQGRLQKGGTLLCRGVILPILPGQPVEKIIDPASGKSIDVHGVIGSVTLNQIGEYRTEVTLI